MIEKSPHPNTYESPSEIDTSIEGGTLDVSGSSFEYQQLPLNDLIDDTYLTSSVDPTLGDIWETFDSTTPTPAYSVWASVNVNNSTIDYDVYNKLGYSPVINKLNIKFIYDWSTHKQLQVSGSNDSINWAGISEEPTPSEVIERDFSFTNTTSYKWYRLKFKEGQFRDGGSFTSVGNYLGIFEVKYYSLVGSLEFLPYPESQHHLTGSIHPSIPIIDDVEELPLMSILTPIIIPTHIDVTGDTGWTLLAYNLPTPENVVHVLFKSFYPNLYGQEGYTEEAQMSELLAYSVQIVKANDASVYWPQYGFNGIGDFIPGQGYQIRFPEIVRNTQGEFVGIGGYFSGPALVDKDEAIPITGWTYGKYIHGESYNQPSFQFIPLDIPNFTATETVESIEQEINNIPTDLLQGWNIIGYTTYQKRNVVDVLYEALFPTGTATSEVEKSDAIGSIVQIVKNNAARVYWPDYGFNGIGEFIPGQGYQIRMHQAFSSFKWPSTSIPTGSNGQYSYFQSDSL